MGGKNNYVRPVSCARRFLSSTQQLGSLPNLSGGHHLHRIFHISLVPIFIRQKAARLNQALENQVIRLYLLSPLRIFATR